MPILSTLIVLPLLGALLVAVLRRDDEALIKGAGLGVALVTLAVSLALWPQFAPARGSIQLREYIAWLPSWGIAWNLGIDGFSLFLVLLTTLLMPLIFLAAWWQIERNVKAFVVAMLVLESAVIGSFVSLNLFFFFVFWELMLVPMLLVIGIWGSGNRVRSALKFFLFTAVGSLLMLVAIGYVYAQTRAQFGALSLNYEDLLRLNLAPSVQGMLFLAFALAFLIKVPLFPLHTWLPDAHTDAPTPGSVILAGVLLKLGTYGLVRFAMPLFPLGAAEYADALVALAVVGIVYGALVAWVQQDIKKLVAYSSVSHMGFVVLGLFVYDVHAATGATMQMINHGLSTGALFLLIGMVYERRHTRDIDAYGGIAAVMPRYALVFLVATLSSIGLPGLNGFVGEFLVLLGSFTAGARRVIAEQRLLALWPAAVAATGVVFGAVYMLTLYMRMFFGPVRHDENRALRDLDVRELVVLAPLIALMLALGVYPAPVLTRIEPSVRLLYERRLDVERPHGTGGAEGSPLAAAQRDAAAVSTKDVTP